MDNERERGLVEVEAGGGRARAVGSSRNTDVLVQGYSPEHSVIRREERPDMYLNIHPCIHLQ